MSCKYGVLQSSNDIWELLENIVYISELPLLLYAATKRLAFHSQTKDVNEKDRTQPTCKCKKAKIPCGSKCHPQSLHARM